MNKYKLVIGIILIFIVGALGGALGSAIYFKYRIDRFAIGGPPPPVRSKMFMDIFARELDLSNEQKVEIEKIVGDTQEKIYALRGNIILEMEEINKQSFSDIMKLLDENQKKKLNALYEEIQNIGNRFAIQTIPYESADNILGRMKERFALSHNQEEKIRSILDKSIEERKKLVEGYKDMESPENFSIRHKFREINMAVETELEKILTEKQMEEYRQMNRRPRRKIGPGMGFPGLGSRKKM